METKSLCGLVLHPFSHRSKLTVSDSLYFIFSTGVVAHIDSTCKSKLHRAEIQWSPQSSGCTRGRQPLTPKEPFDPVSTEKKTLGAANTFWHLKWIYLWTHLLNRKKKYTTTKKETTTTSLSCFGVHPSRTLISALTTLLKMGYHLI